MRLAGACLLALLAAAPAASQPTVAPPPAPASPAAPAAAASPLDSIRLPPGFRIRLFAGGVDGARSMALGTAGTLFVGTLREGRVYAIRDRDGDGVADDGAIVAAGLVAPNGVAFRDGALFVADAWRILRFDGVESRLDGTVARPLEPAVVFDRFPKEAWHGWKFLAFGPDGLLYVPVGAPCDVCDRRADVRFAAIHRMKPDGTSIEVFARGVRNSVGFDWHPRTKELWFTDNGADRLGEDEPPDELDRAPEQGLDFGFPYCHGGRIPDAELGGLGTCAGSVRPEVELGAHVAPLGMRFYRGTAFPKEYRGAIFIAEHGSGARRDPVGYRVTVVRPDAPRDERYRPFAEGWLQGRRAWGRPVDVLERPDGSLLVSDDGAGAVYRITYEPPAR